MLLKSDKKSTYIHYATLFLASILFHWLLVLLGYFSYKTNAPDITMFSFISDRFLNAGDAVHYTYIAKHGYQATGANANNIVFYPLYPLLMKALWFVVRNYALAGIIISQTCFGFATIFLYKLVSVDFSKNKANDAALCMIVYPFSVFTFGIFTEGLFLMLTIMTLYHIRNHKWILVGILGFLAALSRTQGMLLLAPAVYEYLVVFRESKELKIRNRFCWRDLSIIGIPMGFILYLLLNKLIQGDLFAFIKHEAAAPWYQTTKWMNDNIATHYNMTFSYPGLGYIIYWVQIFLYFFSITCLLYALKKKIRMSYIVYGGIYVCMTYLSGWMISGGRYMMGCIPLYLIYASIDNLYVKRFILALLTIFCVIFTILFMQGQSIM